MQGLLQRLARPLLLEQDRPLGSHQRWGEGTHLVAAYSKARQVLHLVARLVVGGLGQFLAVADSEQWPLLQAASALWLKVGHLVPIEAFLQRLLTNFVAEDGQASRCDRQSRQASLKKELDCRSINSYRKLGTYTLRPARVYDVCSSDSFDAQWTEGRSRLG